MNQDPIPAEEDEIHKYPIGSRVSGIIGGLSEHKTGVLVPEDPKECDVLFVDCSNCEDVESGEQGEAVMSETNGIKYWKYERS
jgi:hypothetical protein